ncbi:hypothetical protein G6F62_012586 [Rhizopus arrhizus]|nr:hypothetical protein G6F23_012194 [Rhizopus arrhizus]KAG1318002.1 hypothetical protein G6F62_012586 [Rhizopus arrhizus]
MFVQQVGSSSQVEEESNEEIEENNLFTHLYKISSQKIIAQQVPECLISNSLTEIDYETDPRRFSEAAKVKGQQVSVLVDAGSMISTINEELVEDMALKKDDENEVWIEYGNATKEVARQSVSIHLNIGGNDFVYKLLVVKRQNVPIILGMDFFVETNLLLDPVSKSFIQWVKKLMQGIAKYRFYSWLSMDTVSNCLKL